jgi:hypothetical protein
MSGCPVHPSDDATADRSSGASTPIRWDLIFLTLAMGMLALILVIGLQLP